MTQYNNQIIEQQNTIKHTAVKKDEALQRQRNKNGSERKHKGKENM